MSEEKTPEQIAQEEAAAKVVAEEKARNAEMQKRMTELATENATLRKRQEDLGNEEVVKKQNVEAAQVTAEAQDIVNDLAGDPAKAAQKLASLLNRQKSEAARNAVNEFLPKVQAFIDKKEYLSQIRSDHPEYKKHEKLMAPMIESKIKGGMPLERAIEETMEAFKPLVESQKPNNNAAPAGTGGYTGANPIPASARSSETVERNGIVYKSFAQHSRDETVDEINERVKEARRKHMPSLIKPGS